MHNGRTTALLFGEVGRCAAGTLAGRPPLVVYDRPVPGTPTVVWLFPVVLTVCFRPFGPKVTLALFLFKFTRTPACYCQLALPIFGISDRKGGGAYLKIYRPEGRCNISGERVRAARERAGISQERLAYKIQIAGLDITQKAISRIETGDRIVADYELEYLADALGVTIYYLLGKE